MEAEGMATAAMGKKRKRDKNRNRKKRKLTRYPLSARKIGYI
jgi:hypothetical protein